MMNDYAPMFIELDRGIDCPNWWSEKNKTYQWTNGIPKSNVLVKLVAGISADNRNYVANGMRSRMDDPLSKVFVKQDVVDSLK